MAIGALVTSLLCIPIVPIVLGIIAMIKVKDSRGRQKGGGLALAGLIIGCLHIVGIPIVGAVAGLVTPAVLRAKKSADLTVTTNNMRNLGIYLYAFEDDWGTYPSRQILLENPEAFPGVRDGESSNALLSMLIAGGYTESEEIFAASGTSKPKHSPDNLISPPSRLLDAGECGMGYVLLEGGEGMSSMDNARRPLVVAPLEYGQGGSDPRFDDLPHNGKAAYLRLDQAVKQGRIDGSGRVELFDGSSLFETGPGTAWGDEVPDVRGPE